jgi:repressor LexA
MDGATLDLLPLTYQQSLILRAIYRRTREIGVSPTNAELCEATNTRSRGNINRYLRELEDKGYIRRHPGKTRGIEILVMPDALAKLETETEPPLPLVCPACKRPLIDGEGGHA